MEAIINHWKTLVDQNMVGLQLKGFIVDCRSANLVIDVNEVSGLAAFFRSRLAYFENKRFAYITQSPEQILLPLLLREEDERYETMPFSTLKAAMDWVMS